MDLMASWPLLLSLAAGGAGVVYVVINLGATWRRNQRYVRSTFISMPTVGKITID